MSEKVVQTVPANVEWFETSVMVAPRTTVTIKYISGNWSWDPNQKNPVNNERRRTGPDGNVGISDPRCIMGPPVAEGALLAKVGKNGKPQFIGLQGVVAINAGDPVEKLYLTCNDFPGKEYFDDNEGHITVQITTDV